MRFIRASLPMVMLLLLHCAAEEAHIVPQPGPDATADIDAAVGDAFAPSDGATTFDGATGDSGLVDGVGFTADFRAFLTSQGYAEILRPDLAGPPGYGGRATKGEALTREPVVFIHGNSDRAVGGSLGGWDKSIAGFLAAGYASREIYALTWGPADSSQAANQYHSRKNLELVRHFLDAVLAYTGASKVDIVSHSMGVTLARKAVQGGAANDALGGGAYDLGVSLTNRVDTFVGIAGANVGLSSCYFTGPTTPTCGATNGFYPGTLVGGNVSGMSQFLTDLDATSHFEGAHVISMWSANDEILGPGTLVWGRATGTIPGEDLVVRKDSLKHMECKSETVDAQIKLVTTHAP